MKSYLPPSTIAGLRAVRINVIFKEIGCRANPAYEAVLWGASGVLIGGQIGPRVIRQIDERILKEMFIFVLTLLGIHLLYNSF